MAHLTLLVMHPRKRFDRVDGKWIEIKIETVNKGKKYVQNFLFKKH